MDNKYKWLPPKNNKKKSEQELKNVERMNGSTGQSWMSYTDIRDELRTLGKAFVLLQWISSGRKDDGYDDKLSN